MKKMLRALAMMLSLALCAMMLSGCAANTPAAPTQAPAETQAPVTTPEIEPVKSSSDVLMLVNETPVTRAEVDRWNAQLLSYFSAYYDAEDEAFIHDIYAYALDYAMTYALIGQQAEKMSLTLTDEEKAAADADATVAWESLITGWIEREGGLTENATDEEKTAARTNALAMLESAGYTEAVYKAEAEQDAVYNKVFEAVTADAAVTDAEIAEAYAGQNEADKTAYEGNIGYYEMMQMYGMQPSYVPEGYRGVQHILLTVDPALLETYQSLAAQLEEQEYEAAATVESADAVPAVPEETAAPADGEAAAEETVEPVTAEQVEAARQAILDSVQATTDEIYARIAAGEDFDKLIDEYNTDPGMQDAKTRAEGYAVHQDSIIWDRDFVRAAFSVNEVGAVAEPVVSQFGVHIVKYLRDIPAGPVEMTEEMRAELTEQLLNEKKAELFEQKVNEWKTASSIQYTEELVPYLAAPKAEEAAPAETAAQ